VLTKRALRDLRAHYDYIFEFNPIAAKRVLHEINRKMEWIAELGITGAPRSFIPELRAFPFKNRCIYFTISDEAINVLRVMHGRKDISPNNFPESDT
jgi:plasmid stabilization system protein ParE